jgi:PPK2 family polyphosphate:nucleotide phosphotransferase
MGKKKDNISATTDISRKEIIAEARKISQPFRVGNGNKFRLKDCSTRGKSVSEEDNKALAQEAFQNNILTISALQDKLYAEDKWSLLIIFQAMDAAGKDSAIKHVMSGVNPQGCQVYSFKSPNVEEIDHDYLWRCMKNLPERGRIGIFNRSYYEEVLIVRVHEQILNLQKIPEVLITKDIWADRLKDIRHFEDYLYRNGTIVIKFFLNVSKEEQKKRFIERIDNPNKNWKFSSADLQERKFWNEYMIAYEDMIKNTSTENSPWYVIPADNKPYARNLIASAIISALDSLDLHYPKVSDEKIAELQKLKNELLEEK